MNIFAWVVFGVVVGVVTNIIDPRPSQGGLFGAILLGISGALLGGLVSSVIFQSGITSFNLTTFVIAVLGSLLLLLLGRVFTPD